MVDELRREVEKQATVGRYNRRLARAIENGEKELQAAGFERTDEPFAEFFCTCGRADCDEVLVLTVDEHRFVREEPSRFLVASGHATEADDVILATEEYDVVEVKPEYRDIARAIIASG